jgi:hypothetical protein
MKRITACLWLAPLFLNVSFAQKIVRVNGSAQVKMEQSMTLEETREKAKELAKINAIEQAFGTYTEQQFDMRIEDGKTSYHTIGTTKVKGEWIETTDISFKDNFRTETGRYGKQEVRYVTCNIKGKARKITPKANIEFQVLNSPLQAARTTSFYDGEQLYLWFRSPVSGYLAVYLDNGETAYCLLPDIYTPDKFASGVYVKKDKEYLFFSPLNNDLPQSQVEEYIMFTNKRVEYNTLYIIFSEEEFVKPGLKSKEKQEGKILPRSLSAEKFQKWLADQRAASTSFQDKRVKISIRQKKD